MKLKTKHRGVYIIAIMVVIFIIDFFMFFPNVKSVFTVNHLIYGNEYGLLTEYGGLLNIKDMNFQVWRIVTSIFLHAGIPHLLTNAIPII